MRLVCDPTFCWLLSFLSAAIEGILTLTNSSLRLKNRLLAALPDEVYQRLLPHLEPIKLSIHQVLYDTGEPIQYIYFPHSTVVSLVATMEDGATIEISLVGREGMVGIPAILHSVSWTHRAFVQAANGGVRIKTEHLRREFDRGGALQTLLLRYVMASYTQTAQTAACNRFHT